MKPPTRTVPIPPEALYRLRADIECEDSQMLGEVIAATLQKLASNRIKAWEEVHRIAGVKAGEGVILSLITGEILVYEEGTN